MVLWATILILQGASLVGSTTGTPGVPENITVMFLNPTSVRVSWSTSQNEQVEKYDVTYKPTDARVVVVVAGNSEAVTLSNLRADTQYQLVVTAVKGGKKLRSRPIVFRTLEPPRTSPQQDSAVTGGPFPAPPPPPSVQQPQAYIQIRGVEVGIVVLVLIVWIGAIALFFNRWGKIRMLLPYQPDYKEQLKVPGTGVSASANTAYTHSSSQHACSQNCNDARVLRTLSTRFSSTESRLPRLTTIIARSRTHSSQDGALLHSNINAYQHLHWSNHRVDSIDSTGGDINLSKSNRPRVNSAIDVASFLSHEFLRRHGSTSRLCRKVHSADNLLLASNNRQNSDVRVDDITDGDRETFLKSNRDDSEKSDDTETRQNSLDNAKNESSLFEVTSAQHQSFRDLTFNVACDAAMLPEVVTAISGLSSSSSQSSHAARRFTSWRAAAINGRDYSCCPVRQPTSIEERYYRRSYELTEQLPRCSLPGDSQHPPLLQHHHQHHKCTSAIRHTRSCEYGHRTSESSVEIQHHFGLPILSVSKPSPPDEDNRTDNYL